jgi:hypothetical protein
MPDIQLSHNIRNNIFFICICKFKHIFTLVSIPAKFILDYFKKSANIIEQLNFFNYLFMYLYSSERRNVDAEIL